MLNYLGMRVMSQVGNSLLWLAGQHESSRA